MCVCTWMNEWEFITIIYHYNIYIININKVHVNVLFTGQTTEQLGWFFADEFVVLLTRTISVSMKQRSLLCCVAALYCSIHYMLCTTTEQNSTVQYSAVSWFLTHLEEEDCVGHTIVSYWTVLSVELSYIKAATRKEQSARASNKIKCQDN